MLARGPGDAQMSGPVFHFFANDHRRLDALLSAATRAHGEIDAQSFERFRTGLLKHIAIEEKLLFPALRAARGGTPLSVAAKLRVDHGALAALLVPTPTPDIVEKIRSVLVPHNQREEAPTGVYALCDSTLSAADVEHLLKQVRGFPEVPVNPHNDRPEVMKHIAMSLDLSRRQWLEDGRPDR